MLESEITSPDGRVLAYTVLGASQGPVVVHCHGAPSSRLELAYFDQAFAERDVRVVTIDRPGYGGSSSRPGRRLADWPADAAAVADEVGVDRFAVTGLSSGGAYVLATAALLPDRVVGAAVMSGVTDFSWPEAWNGFLGDEAMLMRMGDEEQISAWCRERYGADGMGFLDEGLDELAPADHAMFEDEALATSLAGSVATAFRQGFAGYAQDVSAQGRAWSFDPGRISAPVLVVHGEADTLVPLAHARRNTDLVPTARLETRPGEGHLSLLLEIPQRADELVGRLRQPP